MTETQPIRQLPELEDHQEWVCDGGCSNIKPRLFRNVYSESWDKYGKKLHELAEHYYTCQEGHLLSVWDNDQSDYLDLPDEAYQERENTYNFSLEQIGHLRKALDEAKEQYTGENLGEIGKIFQHASVAIEATLKNGDILKITYEYLDEIEALFNQNLNFSEAVEDAELNAICDSRKDQKRISVDIEDL